MKRRVSIILVLTAVISILAACGGSAGKTADTGEGATAEATAETTPESVESALEEAKTIGDLVALEGSEEFGTLCMDEYYVYWFQFEGTDYRAVAELTQEQSESIWALDFEDEEYDQKRSELVKDLAVSKIDNLTEGIPSDEELDALVGKTGQDLLDQGWYSGGYNLDMMEFYMMQGAYSFTVVFDGELTVEEVEEIGEEEAISPLTIKAVVCTGIGDGTYMEEAEE